MKILEKIHRDISIFYSEFFNINTIVSFLQKWTDEFMVWNPEDFGSIRYLIVAPNKLWVPDLYFFNGFVLSSVVMMISTDIVKYDDDVIKWKHFPRNWPFVRGIHRSPVNSLHKDQWRGNAFIDLRPNKQLSKQSRRRWFETPSCSLRRHCDDMYLIPLTTFAEMYTYRRDTCDK